MITGYLTIFFPIIFQARLLKNAVECSPGKIIIQVSGDRHKAFLMAMPILPVASLYSYHEPTIAFNHLDGLFDFHAGFESGT